MPLTLPQLAAALFAIPALAMVPLCEDDAYDLGVVPTQVNVAVLHDAESGAATYLASEFFGGLAVSPKRIVADKVSTNALREKGLGQNLQVLLVPAGSGRRYSAQLGEEGREKIRAWIKSGGSYLGFCAGATLAATGPGDHRLAIAPFVVRDTEHWLRGRGTVLVEGQRNGRAWRKEMRYLNGPLLEPDLSAPLPLLDGRMLARFVSDIDGRGVMPNAAAVTVSRYGKGKVILFSGHPEFDPHWQSQMALVMKYLGAADFEEAHFLRRWHEMELPFP